MRVKFWGVCGSIPAPQTPSQIKSKFSAILEQITVEDLQNAESKERFLAGLPPWLFGTVGANTPCVSVTFEESKEFIIFDCGSGIHQLGNQMNDEILHPTQYHVFFSHFHWDHLQGLPFFSPAYDPSVRMEFYSPKPDLEKILSGQMEPPYFPVHIDAMGSIKSYHQLDGPIKIGSHLISYKKMNHPGDSYAYCVHENDKRFIYATDTELTAQDFLKTEENTVFFQDADLIVLDCQYTLGEAIDKYNWGHSAFSLAVDFAANWRIKHMVMFHHDPTYSDRKLHNILQSARWYLERMNIRDIELTLAAEGLEISL
ncbi:MAG: MBL fold metallo-hydrolase [Treponema sp.]|nr:MBL fold metallo-hydrolase [Treponema sp.]